MSEEKTTPLNYATPQPRENRPFEEVLLEFLENDLKERLSQPQSQAAPSQRPLYVALAVGFCGMVGCLAWFYLNR